MCFQASQVEEGCELSCFYPRLQATFWSNTLIAGPTETFFFKIQKESWESNSLSWVPSINLNTFLVTELPSSSSPFAPWPLLFPCLLALFLLDLFAFSHFFFITAPFFLSFTQCWKSRPRQKVDKGPEYNFSAISAKKLGKIGKSQQTLKNTKYIHFFQNFEHLKQQ